MNPLSHAQIAEIAHEANRVYCQHAGGPLRVKWHLLTKREMEGLVSGVEFIAASPNATPHELHEAWFEWMVKDGWSPGGVLDRVAKVHPNLRPWDELPLRERIKDALFGGIVRACLMRDEQEPSHPEDIEPSPGDPATQTAP